MSAPRNPAFGPVTESDLPPLDDHLKTITSNKTRIGKVYDFLFGQIADVFPKTATSIDWIDDNGAVDFILILAATEHMADLPNRKRLVELVEAAMPKEEAK